MEKVGDGGDDEVTSPNDSAEGEAVNIFTSQVSKAGEFA